MVYGRATGRPSPTRKPNLCHNRWCCWWLYWRFSNYGEWSESEAEVWIRGGKRARCVTCHSFRNMKSEIAPFGNSGNGTLQILFLHVCDNVNKVDPDVRPKGNGKFDWEISAISSIYSSACFCFWLFSRANLLYYTYMIFRIFILIISMKIFRI